MKKRSKNPTWIENNKKLGISRQIPVLQYSKTGEFIAKYSNAKIAAQIVANSNSAGAIQHCCTGISKSAYGYVWKYEKLGNGK